MIAQATIPFIVTSEEDVPLNDKVWFGLAGLAVLTTFTFVRRSQPKTPPSYSDFKANRDRASYLIQLKTVLTNGPFLILFWCVGGGVVYRSTIPTMTQQILCPIGYSEAFGGLVNSLIMFCGIIGAVLAALLLDKTKMYVEIIMCSLGGTSLVGIVLFEFFLVPHRQIIIVVISVLFGLIMMPIVPVGLELAVEATFPADESITAALIFLSGQLQSVLFIVLIPVLSRERADSSLSVCNLYDDDTSKDYTVFLLTLMAFMSISASFSILFFKTEYKRQNAEKLHNKDCSKTLH